MLVDVVPPVCSASISPAEPVKAQGTGRGLVAGGVSGGCGEYVGGLVVAVHSVDEDDVAA
jgi:hypothetical protein